MSLYLNPKRKLNKSIFFKIKHLFIRLFINLGFSNVDYYYVHGEGSGNHLFIGGGVSTCNALFNISCGNIYIGKNTLFGHGVNIITGFHSFHEGKFARLSEGSPKEVPDSGYDIHIGEGCFLGTNCIILKSVTVGDNSIICAGAIVTKSVPSNSFVYGINNYKKIT